MRQFTRLEIIDKWISPIFIQVTSVQRYDLTNTIAYVTYEFGVQCLIKVELKKGESFSLFTF